jgi:hypothetical protein
MQHNRDLMRDMITWHCIAIPKFSHPEWPDRIVDVMKDGRPGAENTESRAKATNVDSMRARKASQ